MIYKNYINLRCLVILFMSLVGFVVCKKRKFSILGKGDS